MSVTDEYHERLEKEFVLDERTKNISLKLACEPQWQASELDDRSLYFINSNLHKPYVLSAQTQQIFLDHLLHPNTVR